MVHARKLEDVFCSEGYKVDYSGVVYNDFVILGPKNNHAGIKDIILYNNIIKKHGFFPCFLFN